MSCNRWSIVPAFIVAISIAVLSGRDPSQAAPHAQEQASSGSTQTSFFSVPDTISPDWQERLGRLPDPSLRPPWPAPDDHEGWRALQEAQEATRMPSADAALTRYQPTILPRELRGVPVLDIKPRDWQDDGKILVYAHGGNYTFYSSRSALSSSVLVADTTSLRVISVDYTLAPIGKWDHVTDQMISVFEGLQDEGYQLQGIAVYGDSAGGALAAGSVLKMRDRGLGMPAAIVVWSPWADITDTGDTYATLAHADPTVVYANYNQRAASAYAAPWEQQNPYVSVYADFSGGFPPTLIQGGTKEIFLSNFVRLYQALDMAGIPVTLDLYEGMPHLFQQVLPDSPESRIALSKTRAFLNTYLGR